MSARVDPEVAPQIGTMGIERKADPEKVRGIVLRGSEYRLPELGQPRKVMALWGTLDVNDRSWRFYCSACGGVVYWPQAHRGKDRKVRKCGYTFCPWCQARMSGTTEL